jgi:hypothetical protein
MTKEKIPMLKLGALVQFCLLLGGKADIAPASQNVRFGSILLKKSVVATHDIH